MPLFIQRWARDTHNTDLYVTHTHVPHTDMSHSPVLHADVYLTHSCTPHTHLYITHCMSLTAVRHAASGVSAVRQNGCPTQTHLTGTRVTSSHARVSHTPLRQAVPHVACHGFSQKRALDVTADTRAASDGRTPAVSDPPPLPLSVALGASVPAPPLSLRAQRAPRPRSGRSGTGRGWRGAALPQPSLRGRAAAPREGAERGPRCCWQHVGIALPDAVPLLRGAAPPGAPLRRGGADHGAAGAGRRLVGRAEGGRAARLVPGQLRAASGGRSGTEGQRGCAGGSGGRAGPGRGTESSAAVPSRGAPATLPLLAGRCAGTSRAQSGQRPGAIGAVEFCYETRAAPDASVFRCCSMAAVSGGGDAAPGGHACRPSAGRMPPAPLLLLSLSISGVGALKEVTQICPFCCSSSQLAGHPASTCGLAQSTSGTCTAQRP